MRNKIGYLLATVVVAGGCMFAPLAAHAASNVRPIVYVNGLDGHVVSIKPDGTDRHDYGPGFLPKMSPDGTKIAFTRDTSDYAARDLYAVNTDGTDLHKVSDHVYTPGSPSQSFTWSPDNTKLVFKVESGYFDPHTGSAYKEIATASVDGTNQTQLTHDDAGVNNMSPNWSPDGSKILYNHNTDLYMMNADGSNQHLVVGGATDGSWAPDSTKILFLEVGVGVRTADLDGGNRVTLSAVGNDARWSPSGDKIVMEAPECGCNTGQTGILTVKPDGSDKKLLAPPPTGGSVQHPVWSPDGSTVAFVEFASWEPTRLVTVPAAGGDRHVVIVESVGDPEWSYLAPQQTTPPPPPPIQTQGQITIHIQAAVQAQIQVYITHILQSFHITWW